ncbi:polysaccharide deacetylase family protein [Magnetofaba australis]|nr:polysaccharide deacetylase family protein [Magnetofaba australis]
MRQPLTIVMYHYVRPIARSRYVGIKGLEKNDFLQQLDYLQRHYVMLSMVQAAACLRGDETLPSNAALLTFDDGYLDHYLHVFPHLLERGLTAAFYPPVCAARDRQVLDVNKIHYILACQPDSNLLIEQLDAAVEAARDRFDLLPLAQYVAEWKKPFGYDTAEVIYIKRMLQHVLPAALRGEIVDALFARCVSADEAAFADELYMDVAQLKTMIGAGMHVGGHGAAHDWLDRLSDDAQAADIATVRDFLGELGALDELFTFCYPYGGHNATTRRLLREAGCALAVTTEPRVAHVGEEDALTLPRLDTNAFPRQADAAFVEPKGW